ncbi:MAG: serine hydrolase domain-containing protein [Chitinophagales bacterium]
MKAEELGLLKLDDSINKHLPFAVANPKYPNADITIRQLATHTSSLDYNEKVVESLYIEESKKDKSLKQFMEDYFQKGIYGTVKYTEDLPGSNWNYSNIGAGLAAYIIEYKSGMTFSDFTEKHIFKPLKLTHTSWFESEVDSLNRSKYYESAKDSILEVATSGVQLYPCRDLLTNIEDLTKYCQAIMSQNPAVLKKESFEELLQPNISSSVTNQEADNNGIFFFIDRNQYGIMYQLTGGSGGDNCINSMMFFDPQTMLGYIFIGNTGPAKWNRSNHIRIYRALVSLGEYVSMNNPDNSFVDVMGYKWHNWYNRVRAFF